MAKPRSVRLEIASLPTPLNQWSRLHWSKRSAEAILWRMMVKIAHLAATKPAERGLFGPSVVTLTFFSPRPRDADGQAKFPLDGLVGVVLPDDSSRWVRELRLRREKGKARTIIEVEECA